MAQVSGAYHMGPEQFTEHSKTFGQIQTNLYNISDKNFVLIYPYFPEFILISSEFIWICPNLSELIRIYPNLIKFNQI